MELSDESLDGKATTLRVHAVGGVIGGVQRTDAGLGSCQFAHGPLTHKASRCWTGSATTHTQFECLMQQRLEKVP